MSQPPPQYPPGSPDPGGVPPGGWGTPPGSGPPPTGLPPQGWGPGGPGGPDGGPPQRSKAPLVVVLVVLVALAAAGGIYLLTQDEGHSEEEQAYIDAITDAAEANEQEEFPLTEEENRCLATAAVDTVGVEQLREAATPEEIRETTSGEPLENVDLDLGEAGDYFDRANDCIDFRDVFLESLEQGGGLSSEQISCVDDSIDDRLLRDLFVAEFAEDEDAADEADRAADDATEDCDLPDS